VEEHLALMARLIGAHEDESFDAGEQDLWIEATEAGNACWRQFEDAFATPD
jgi:hypothetical protein